jgi:cbb3-type cytochrome oxidase subunit 3
MSEIYSFFTVIMFILIIAALLRHLNLERKERREMMERYQNLALRVRQTQLEMETPEQYMERGIRFPEPQTSVADVEGTF